jgi:transcriptional regulator with XRE-family HTH domain
MKKDKKENTLPALCVIVKQVRKAYAESQPRFAQRVSLAPQTVSRFERGVQVPADFEVLTRLAQVARAKNLTEQAIELERVANQTSQASSRIEELGEKSGRGAGLWAMPIHSIRQWRLMHIGGITAVYFPENLRTVEQAIEQVAGEAAALVDEAIRQYAGQPIAAGLGFHDQLCQVLMKLAAQRDIEQYKSKGTE